MTHIPWGDRLMLKPYVLRLAGMGALWIGLPLAV